MAEQELPGPIGDKPHIGVRIKPVAGTTVGAAAYVVEISRATALSHVAELVCSSVGLPPNGVTLVYEGRTLEVCKTLEDNGIMLPGPAARRRGDKVELQFDAVTEVVVAQQREKADLEAAEQKLVTQKRLEEDRLAAEKARREEEAIRDSQVDAEFEAYISEHVGVSALKRQALLDDKGALDDWNDSKKICVDHHFLAPESDEVCKRFQQLVGDASGSKVIRVFRNENETLRRRYERAKGLVAEAGSVTVAHTQTQDKITGRPPLDFLGPYDPSINEFPMWHGTPNFDGAGGIASTGFDIAYAGAHGLAWGHGFYFADNPQTSIGYCRGGAHINKKYQRCSVLFLCRIIAGNIKSLSQAPTQDQKERLVADCLGPGGNFGAKSKYHSICGGGWAYVCAHRDQVYPAYVIVLETG